MLKELFSGGIRVPSRKKVIVPKTPAQKKYIEAIRNYDIVLGIGPAGTGKTYLAMAMAVYALTNQEVGRIILVRPAVEAGEHLGFLPGDLYQKIHPYLRPLYDALYDMMDPDRANRMIERGTIEIAPLAYMRGRTLNDSFIILDEGQNTTTEQMKMFLTRLGFNSRVVVTGDITQVDLPKDRQSGLIQAKEILHGIHGIHLSFFTDKDVIRHKLVQDIVRAYERHEKK
jgi:phosphate starvation-inducible PhoH-like protein